MPTNITLKHDLQLWTNSNFNETIAIVRDAEERQTVDLTTDFSARAEARRRPGTPTLLMSFSTEGPDPTIELGSKGEITLNIPASMLTQEINGATWGIQLDGPEGYTQLILWGTFTVRKSPVHLPAP